MPPEHEALLGIKRKEGAHTVVDIIKELFYSTGRTPYQIFRAACSGDRMDVETFIKIVSAYSGGVLAEADIKSAFHSVCKSGNRDSVSFREFEEGFRLPIPTPTLQSETRVIRKVREWMFSR